MDLDEVLAPAREQAQVFLVLIVSLTLFAAYGPTACGVSTCNSSPCASARNRRTQAGGNSSARPRSATAPCSTVRSTVFSSRTWKATFSTPTAPPSTCSATAARRFPPSATARCLFPRTFPARSRRLQEVIRIGPSARPAEYTPAPQGRPPVVVESKTVLVYAGDEPSAILGIARDVTERTLAAGPHQRALTRIRDDVERINTLSFARMTDRRTFRRVCRCRGENGSLRTPPGSACPIRIPAGTAAEVGR